jgi:hypothetical protein
MHAVVDRPVAPAGHVHLCLELRPAREHHAVAGRVGPRAVAAVVAEHAPVPAVERRPLRELHEHLVGRGEPAAALRGRVFARRAPIAVGRRIELWAGDHGIEQDQAPDSCGVEGGGLGHRVPAHRMPDPDDISQRECAEHRR